ncbi:MAG TPA: hypothetical protein VK092_04655 [Deinococcales bacterium]|nr:hypothetical protein [Deinococcales bacterium]
MTSDLLALAQYGEKRHTQVVSDSDEARLVLFSLQDGQQVRGRGEPRVHMLALEGEGELWAGEKTVPAAAGTMIACDADVEHGARAGAGRFLVLGIITPRP